MGTPDFAVASLDKIVQAGYNVVGVITAPDRPAGRGKKLTMSAVKQYAQEHNLKVLQPTNLKDETFIKELEGLKPDLQVVVAFRMLPKTVWQIPTKGTFNLHGSLLPQYRGAAPINWAIINGEAKTGVTTFFIDEKIDTGEIIAKAETTISNDDTAGSLHDRLMELGANLVIDTIADIDNNTVTTKKQVEDNKLKTAPKIHKETCRINWEDSLDAIYNHIRGLSPYPAAWTELISPEGEKIFCKIYSASKENNSHSFKVGTIISNNTNEVKVAVEGGFISINAIQLAGKRKIPISEFLNGFKFSEGWAAL